MNFQRSILWTFICLGWLIQQNDAQAQRLKQVLPAAIGNQISVDYLNDQVAYAVTSEGYVSKTTDGGTNWIQVYNFPRTAYDIEFVSTTTGFVVAAYAANGGIYRTTDGGHTWTKVNVGNAFLSDIFFLDSQTGFAVGARGGLQKTTDGGDNWTNISTGTNRNLTSVHFVDASNGFIVGQDVALKTTDGGTNWTSMYSNASGKTFNQVQFFTAQKGYMMEQGILYITTDGGANWSTSRVRPALETRKFIFTDENTGYAIQVGLGTGNAYKSTDGGLNWTQLTTPPPPPNTGVEYKDVHFLNNNQGYIVGKNGLIIQTTDGGVTWTQVNQLANKSTRSPNVTSITFRNSNKGYAIEAQGKLLTTEDGGTTWAHAPNPDLGINYTIRHIEFINESIGFLGTDRSLYRTADGGNSWEIVLPFGISATSTSITHHTDQNIFLTSGGAFRRSYDGGKTWIAPRAGQTIPGKVVFTDAYTGYGIKQGELGFVFTTNDGGETWTKKLIGTDTFYNITSNGKNRIYICSANGAVYFTSYGGTRWTKNTITPSGQTATFRHIAFYDEFNGYTAGTTGTIYQTKDNGRSWQRVEPIIHENTVIMNMDYVDQNVVMTGTNGTIIKAINGKMAISQATNNIDAGGNYDFGALTIGQSSDEISFTIKNNGDDNLELTQTPLISISGAQASEFSITSQPSSSIVGASSNFKVKFSPTSLGNKNAVITIPNNTPSNNFVINVTGLAKQAQTIAFSLGSNATKTVGDPNFGLTATGGASGNPITFTSSNPNVATISGDQVTIVGAGSTIITAKQAGNATYASAQATQSLTVNKADQTIRFDLGSDANQVVGNAAFTLSALGGASGKAITFTSSNTSIATITGNTVTIVGAGLANITANQEGNANYNQAASVSQTLTVGKGEQSIRFDLGNDAVKNVRDADFTLSGTASSNLTVSYTSSNTSVATVSGNTVKLIGEGSTIITANQIGNKDYNAAPEVTQTLTVNNKSSQTITFSLGSNANKTFGDANFNLSATTSSGLDISYTSSNTAVATISGNVVTIVGAGTTTITASQAGNDSFNPAADVTQSLTISKASQAITFTLETDANKVVGDAPFVLSATGGASGNPVTFTSSDTDVAIITDNTVTIVGEGTTTITASQAGNDNFDPAADVNQSLTVSKSQVTALPQNLKEAKVILFPNPFVDDLTMEVQGKTGNNQVKIVVLDNQGKEVLATKQTLVNGRLTLPMQRFQAGQYLLKITFGEGVILHRVTKL